MPVFFFTIRATEPLRHHVTARLPMYPPY